MTGSHSDYLAARAKAQADANRDGFDRGLEWNPIFRYWTHRLLPGRDFRYGWETRCEIIMCDRMDKAQKGHGPVGNRPRAWSEADDPRRTAMCAGCQWAAA